MGHNAKWEYFRAVYERYHKEGRETKQLMLNEFCLNTGYRRKYAIRLLNGPSPGKQPERQPHRRRPRYGHQGLSILAAIWQAAGYPRSLRLKALLPRWMPWIRKRYRISRHAGHQCSTNRPALAGEEERAQTAYLRSHQARLSVETPNPGENG